MIPNSERKKLIKKAVIARDGTRCIYCGKQLSHKTITMDHIIPVSKNGYYYITNLTVACSCCNMERGNEEFFAYLKKHNPLKLKPAKYKEIQERYWRVRVLNTAKEHYIKNEYHVPQELIDLACEWLNLKRSRFTAESWHQLLPNHIEMDFEDYYKRSEIIYVFEQLILVLER